MNILAKWHKINVGRSSKRNGNSSESERMDKWGDNNLLVEQYLAECKNYFFKPCVSYNMDAMRTHFKESVKRVKQTC